MKIKPFLDNINDLSDHLDSLKIESRLKMDIINGVAKNSMSLRLTHHVLSLIDWDNPTEDPIRKQFLPFHSEYLPPHPQLKIDSLAEEKSQVLPGLFHRYPNKVLFLLSNYCPTYCAFCTRSYAVGPDTKSLKKKNLLNATKALSARHETLKEFLNDNSDITDVVLSGGDIASVGAVSINNLLKELANIESLRTIRLATRTLLFEPSLFFPNTLLFDVITQQCQKLKQCNKELSIQCHFNHVKEISTESKNAALSLWKAGVTIRNQTVLLDGINSSLTSQKELIKGLIESGIQPYYVYQMDMVANAEHFRTSLSTCISISKKITGFFTGFQSPRFIVDLPSGGGKRSVYEYEFYDEKYGVYGFKSPLISEDKIYYYCDPIRYLEPNIQEEWKRNSELISSIYP